jgi:nitrogen fixation NifU-like protein
MQEATELEELYQEIILDHYRSPRNRRRGDGSIEVRHDNPLCGDELTLRLELSGGEVASVSWEGHGCSISQASASMMSEAVEGLPATEARTLIEQLRQMMRGEPPVEDLGDVMALEGVSKFPVRIKCALLAWMALKDALEQAETGGKS